MKWPDSGKYLISFSKYVGNEWRSANGNDKLHYNAKPVKFNVARNI